MSIAIIINYARSGGTLLNRCIGSLPDVVILSEVSPLRTGEGLNTPITVQRQARDWYGIELRSQGFVEAIKELKIHCQERGKRLVVRLWCIAEFRPTKQNNHRPPGKLLGYETLRSEFGDLRAIAFIRDPIDIWISNGCKKDFFKWYRHYLEAVLETEVPLFKYEEFCANPAEQLTSICDSLGVLCDKSYENFASFRCVRGDLKVPGGSRGSKLNHIAVLRRRQIATARVRWVNKNADMKIANRLVQYPQKYHGVPCEHWAKRILEDLRYLRHRGRNQ